jgi:GTP-binding protein Era
VSRAGTVAIVGRPNVGKSTLLNAALDMPLAIVSPTPQTTRQPLLGVVKHRTDDGDDAELRLLDTPGLHRAETALGRAMNRSAREAARGCDVVVFVTDLPRRKSSDPLRPHLGDLSLLGDIEPERKTILVINKVDTLRDKAALLPLLEGLAKVRTFEAIVPVSARTVDGVERVLEAVARALPTGPHAFGEDDVTDKPARWFVAEYVREQVLLLSREEVPHATAVSVDAFEESERITRIAATLHVDRIGHKKILVGAGGAMLKRIGTEARKRIEQLVGRGVYLELFVRVSAGWRDGAAMLEELGYTVEERGAEYVVEWPDSESPDSESPDSESPDSESPDAESPDAVSPETQDDDGNTDTDEENES